MNKNESKYFKTALRMNNALLQLLDKKDFAFITVKEICQIAEVNRSTFYLHYETTYDLLMECVENISKDFFSRFNVTKEDIEKSIHSSDTKELFLMTPNYLLPYLDFIKDYKKVFKVIYNHSDTFGSTIYKGFYNNIFSPILERFAVPQKEHKYIMEFYIKGVMGIIMEWVNNDCNIDKEEVISIINRCIKI